MKRKFTAIPGEGIFAARLSRVGALRAIAEQLQSDSEFSDCEINVNTAHNCVDVILPDDTMKQVYPKVGDTYDSYGYRYTYVGSGNGDYLRSRYNRNRTSYEAEPELVKHVTRRTSSI